jgi:RHS repeat-associated protein
MPGVWRHTGVVRYGRHPDKEEVQSGTTWNSKYAYMNQPSAIGSTVARFDLGANYTLDSTDTYYFYHYDEAGNVILITDKNGNVVDHFEQDAWGNDLNNTFNTARSIAQHQTSKFYDTTTGLYFFGARWYYPEIGRFISVSSFESITEEEYAYCSDDPVNIFDPNGYLGLSVFDAIDAIGFHYKEMQATVPGSVVWGNSPEASKQIIQNTEDGAVILLDLSSNLCPALKAADLAMWGQCFGGIYDLFKDPEIDEDMIEMGKKLQNKTGSGATRGMHRFAKQLSNFGGLEIRKSQGGYTKYFLNKEFVTRIPHSIKADGTANGIIQDILKFIQTRKLRRL